MSAMPHGESGSAKKIKNRSKKMSSYIKKISLEAACRMANRIKGILNFLLRRLFIHAETLFTGGQETDHLTCGCDTGVNIGF